MILTFLFLGCKKHKARDERRKFQDLVEITIINSSYSPMTDIKLYIQNNQGVLSNETFFGHVLSNDTLHFIYNCRNKIDFEDGGQFKIFFNCDDRERVQEFGLILYGLVEDKGYYLTFLEEGRQQPVRYAYMETSKITFPKNSYSYFKRKDANKYN